MTPQASVRQYFNTVKRIPQIAQELGVDYVLDIGGYCEDDVLVYSAHLINAGRDECIWTCIYTGRTVNPMAEQRRIVHQIAADLERQLR